MPKTTETKQECVKEEESRPEKDKSSLSRGSQAPIMRNAPKNLIGKRYSSKK